jgi:hypothetical protein
MEKCQPSFVFVSFGCGAVALMSDCAWALARGEWNEAASASTNNPAFVDFRNELICASFLS